MSREGDEPTLQVAGVRLGQVGVLVGEHDRTIPEILASLSFRAGVLSQSLTDVVSFAYVGQRAAKRLRIVAEQDVSAGAGGLLALQQRSQV